jgi:hypothetical protein
VPTNPLLMPLHWAARPAQNPLCFHGILDAAAARAKVRIPTFEAISEQR